MGSKRELSPDENIKLGALGGKLTSLGLAAGVTCLAAAAVWGVLVGDGMSRFFHSYLLGFVYVLSWGLGALFFVLIQHLVSAHWSVVVRRIAEGMLGAFPLLFLLALGIAIPVFLGYDGLFVWTNKEAIAADPNLAHAMHAKGSYLNPGFFAARVLIYFAFLLGASRYFIKNSLAQDESGDPKLTDKMRRVSAPAIIVFAFVLCFAAFDLIMSLEPTWFSTIFGVYYFAGCAMSIHGLLALAGLFLRRNGRLGKTITVEHYHDLGKLLFAFNFFWCYVAFSQFMLIWYANIPEEVTFWEHRWLTDWRAVTLFLLVGHFLIPFPILMSRWTKRVLPLLAFFATWLLVMQAVDLYYLIMPNFNPSSHHIALHPMDALCVIGMVGLFVAVAARSLKKVNLVPVKDPRLAKSLAHENI